MATHPLRVAIADDDRMMREMLEQLLRNLGHEVVAVAENGRELIDQALATQPDVVITDNLMPDVNGADAAAIIHAQCPAQIILLSAYCDRELVLDAEQKHILMYLVKPVSQEHLEAALHRCQELRDSEIDESEEELHQGEFHGEHHRTSGATVYRGPAPPPYRQMRRPR